MIIKNKEGICKSSQQLPNNLKLKILGNLPNGEVDPAPILTRRGSKPDHEGISHQLTSEPESKTHTESTSWSKTPASILLHHQKNPN